MADKPQCQVCHGTGKVYALRRDGRVDRTDWRLDCPLCLKLAHTAALAAARREGAEEMRERAAQAARRVELPGDCSPQEAHGRMAGSLAAAEAIRALEIEG